MKDETVYAIAMSILCIFLAGLILLGINSAREYNELEKLCESKNGVFYQPYKSRGICLKSEDVIILKNS